MNRCTFTQTTKFTSLIPPHDEHFEQIQCENMTEEQFDEYGRVYCKEHRNKVDEINKSRHKNCINKEKLILDIDEIINDKNPHRTYTEYVFSLKERRGFLIICVSLFYKVTNLD
ncbi:hypothetical protein [Spiroplasma ixodetis]|uniref:Uncharacterized protein n=1 Tax=Spiroplasma ixodetis TaxID=2141 RepID=A0ABM8BX36_9MOLU|nr:hypothetical protein [Spiroplasma ixodetis]BDT04436.1 hypothetical protein SHM_20820 [Spiroplasma ixodetis]